MGNILFATTAGEHFCYMMLTLGAIVWGIKKMVSPKIQDAAKNAATNKALDWISRMFK